MKHQSCKLIEAENVKLLAEMRSKAKATNVLKEAEAYETMQMIQADQEVAIIKANAQARLNVAQSKCQALEKEADAEMDQCENLEAMRRH